MSGNYHKNMKPTEISVDEVIQFAADHAGTRFWTLTMRRPFTIRTVKHGIRFDLPSETYYPINRTVIDKYLKCYNASLPKSRYKTTIYPQELRETSYMASILFEMEREKQRDGLDDLDIPGGSDCPDRAKSISYPVVRDAKVPAYILERAAGKCEYCGKPGFLTNNGRHYLESHHIIALSEQGEDTVDNVIALCPGHHREAHYGKESESLERKFLIRIGERKW